jgi:tubulin beta
MACYDHGIGPEGAYCGFSDYQLQKADVYFHETDGKYVPRSVLIDLDPTSLDAIKSSAYGGLFNPDNFV